MIEVRRVTVAGAFVAAAAVFTCSHLWGDPKLNKDRDLGSRPNLPLDKIDRRFGDEMIVNPRPRNRTQGLVAAKDLDDAFKELDKEFPAGAANLKQGLAEAVTQTFKGQDNRQRAVVLLGDGRSLAGPVDADERARLSEELVKREAAFYAVPLGPNPDPVTLHGFANATGGKVVRL